MSQIIKSEIVGRSQEIHLLQKIATSNSAELVAVHGRRRIGKTYLIRTFFQRRASFYFESVGIKDGSTLEQIALFKKNLETTFYDGMPLAPIHSWADAFEALALAVEKKASLLTTKLIVVFLDELPWMATQKSNLVQILDQYWNSRFSRINKLKMVVCGSAASWILENLIHAKGGLYNRITRAIRLDPFTLKETHAYLSSLGMKYSLQQSLEIYMAIGGVPHYLQQLEPGHSAAQNIDLLCFSKNGLLREEFKHLFKSLFDLNGGHQKIVETIAKNRFGISRTDLIARTNLQSGGTLNKWLTELEASGFIQSYLPLGNKRKSTYYRVLDEYSVFYLHWIAPRNKKTLHVHGGPYWLQQSQRPSYYSWAGYAFESVCFKHIDQIQKAMKIDTIPCEVGSWRKGTQIDLLFDRSDRSISLCEIKHTPQSLSLTRALAEELKKKIQTFQEKTKTKKQVFLTLITPFGIKENTWSKGLIDSVVTLEDLFS